MSSSPAPTDRGPPLPLPEFVALIAALMALTALGIEVQMSKDGVKLKAPPGFDGTGLEGVL